VQLEPARPADADVAKRQMGRRAVRDRVEGDDGARAQRILSPVPGEADVLRWVEGDDSSDAYGLVEPDPNRPAHARLELRFVHPCAKPLRRRDEREHELARGVDLDLQLDARPVVIQSLQGSSAVVAERREPGSGRYSALTALTSWPSPSLASAKSIPVFGCV
jgi:hypothetical protein